MRGGFDYSGGWPGVSAIKAAGGSFVGRYLAYDHPRGITAGEVAALNGAGIDVIGYYEEHEQSILQGFQFGVRAAQTALQVLASCGVHGPVPVNIACDFDIDPSQIGPVYAALDGCASVIGRQNTGIYGGVVPVHLGRSSGKATYGVQAGAWRIYRAASVGVHDPYGWSPLAQVRQDVYGMFLNGVGADHLTALAGDFGQWRRPGPINPVPPDSTPTDPHQFDHKPTLREGMNTSDVSVAKFILNYAMSTKLAPGNLFDHNMYQAVYFWQGLANLQQDGIIGTATWKSFGAYVARVHRFDLCQVLHFGNHDDPGFKTGVGYNPKDWPDHALQTALNEVSVHGYTPLKVDGVYGTTTQDCVAQYQRNRHLAVDGICGKTTWSDLGALVTHYGH